MRDLLDFCEGQLEWLLDTIKTLVALESPTTDKAALDRCGVVLAERLTAIGGRVQPLPRETAGNHLLTEFGCGESQILILGHFDTVWPVGQIARMPCRIDGGRLHGPGAFDMKAGIAIGMLAARALYETGHAPGSRLVMLWTTDEEMGSTTSRTAIEDEASRSRAVLVLEPSLPGGAVKTSRKGCGEYELTVRGVSAHAGIDPGAGASAIAELAAQIVELRDLPAVADGVSFNVGVIEGGTRSNVVAEHARAIVDVRVPTLAARQAVETRFRSIQPRSPRTSVEVSGGISRPPLERTAAVIRLYEHAKEVAAGLGIDLREGGTGGGSDGNFTAALGVPTLDGLGAVGDGAHALHEHVVIDALAPRAALVAGLIQRIAASTIPL
jgi:glutamate carboxypeptidase